MPKISVGGKPYTLEEARDMPSGFTGLEEETPVAEPPRTSRPYLSRRELFERFKTLVGDYGQKGTYGLEDFTELAGLIHPDDENWARHALKVINDYNQGKGDLSEFVELAKGVPPERGFGVPGGPGPIEHPGFGETPETETRPERPEGRSDEKRPPANYGRPAQPSISFPKQRYEAPGRPKKFTNPFAWKS